MTPGLIIAAPASGSGKTVLTLGLLRHLTGAGTRVSSCKVGPDYIDPAFHAVASGRACLNLDLWAMRGETVRAVVARAAEDADLIVCEGVMGLFDGATSGEGSTADVAAATGWPVVLVVDAAAQAASAAAVVRGFASHRADVTVAGVIFNRVGSETHAEILRTACAEALPDLPVLGCVRRDDALALPERHLGLVQAAEIRGLEALLDGAAAAVAAQVAVERLTALATPADITMPDATVSPPVPPFGQRVSVARDAAFAFAYPAVLDGWRGAGCELSFFSPLDDQLPGRDADAIYLPGGYPELHAGTLADGRLPGALRQAADRGALIYGECGGYMVLGQGLIDGDGARHAMAGLLDLETSFAERRLHLGYREARIELDSPFAEFLDAPDASIRGHEFHYATIFREGPGKALFHCRDAAGRDLGKSGLFQGTAMGSFVHVIDRAAA